MKTAVAVRRCHCCWQPFRCLQGRRPRRSSPDSRSRQGAGRCMSSRDSRCRNKCSAHTASSNFEAAGRRTKTETAPAPSLQARRCGVTTATDTGRASSRRSSASACRARCSARGSPTRSTLSRRASHAGRSTSRAVTALAGTAIVHGRATHGRWSSWTRSLALSSEDFGQRTRRRRKPRLACAESCAGANLWPGASSGGMRHHATTTT